ncbi:alkaline phosphatase [Coprobacter secundus]|uniref:alkaline phosphatase n=1 Tax=Coprobacter secundus TaxID=1501392 RepID=UPI0005743D11|nr:hypothetical protein PU94_11525 [Coprobacter secundus]
MKKYTLLFLLLFAFSVPFRAAGPKYIFFFIGDGMGLNQVEAARQYNENMPDSLRKKMTFLSFPVQSVVTTFSASNRITDSAAAGTALATGEKTTNGTLGLNSKNRESIAKQFKKSGRKVGIITSVSIDHATPGAFYATQPERDMYYEIGLQGADSGFDFLGGSGLLQPQKAPDKINLYDYFRDNDYTICWGKNDYKYDKNFSGKILFLSNDSLYCDALKYSIDRKPEELSLLDLTECALHHLSQNSPKGFFVMIEGGKIDWASHSNDAATMIKETLDFSESIQCAYDFYLDHPRETLIIITADHETGGCILGNGTMDVNTELLQYQKMSGSEMSFYLEQVKKKHPGMTWTEMRELLSELTGLGKEVPLTLEEEARLMVSFQHWYQEDVSKSVRSLYSETNAFVSLAISILNEKAHISWASDNHSASQVPLFAIGEGASRFSGRLDNTDIPQRLIEITRLK